jgi:hypothetical protein
MVDAWFILPYPPPPPPPPRCPTSLPTMEHKPHGAPPLCWGMWAREKEEFGKGMEQPEGGPRKWEAQPVRHENGPRRGSFSPFPHPSPSLTSQPRSRWPQQPGTAERQPGQPHNHANGRRTLRWRKRRHSGPNDDTAGSFTMRSAQGWCPRTTRTAQGQRERSQDNASGPRTTRTTQRRRGEPRDNTNDPRTPRTPPG